jgi:hypothetical protein
MLHWSEWVEMDALPDHDGPAVYEFRAVVGGKPISIPRFLRSDEGGTLVYGSTGNMDRRYWQSRVARERAYGSSTMNLLYYLEHYTDLLRLYPGLSYEYRFAPVKTVEEAKLHEARLIKQYVCRFGDRPPLNSAFPDREGDWAAD